MDIRGFGPYRDENESLAAYSDRFSGAGMKDYIQGDYSPAFSGGIGANEVRDSFMYGVKNPIRAIETLRDDPEARRQAALLMWGKEANEKKGIGGLIDRITNASSTVGQMGKAAMATATGALQAEITGDDSRRVNAFDPQNWISSNKRGGFFDPRGFRETPDALAFDKSAAAVKEAQSTGYTEPGYYDALGGKSVQQMIQDKINDPRTSDGALKFATNFNENPAFKMAVAEKTGKVPGVETAQTPGDVAVQERAAARESQQINKLYSRMWKWLEKKDLMVGDKLVSGEQIRNLPKEQIKQFFDNVRSGRLGRVKSVDRGKGVGGGQVRPARQYKPTRQERLTLARGRGSHDTQDIKDAQAIMDKAKKFNEQEQSRVASAMERSRGVGTPVSTREKVAQMNNAVKREELALKQAQAQQKTAESQNKSRIQMAETMLKEGYWTDKDAVEYVKTGRTPAEVTGEATDKKKGIK